MKTQVKLLEERIERLEESVSKLIEALDDHVAITKQVLSTQDKHNSLLHNMTEVITRLCDDRTRSKITHYPVD